MSHKCFATFLVFCLFFTISATIFFAEMRVFTKPESVRKIVNDSKIFEKVPKLIELATKNSNPNENENSAVLMRVVSKSINPESLKKEFDKNIEPFFAYLNNQGDLSAVSFDLRIPKQELNANINKYLGEEILNLPICEGGVQIDGEEGLPSCLSEGVNRSQVQQQVTNSNTVGEMLTEIPDDYRLTDVKNSQSVFGSIKKSFQALKISFYISLSLSLLFILLLVLLGRKYWPSIPRWVGLSLVLPSGAYLLLNIFSSFLPKLIESMFFKSTDSELTKLLKPMIESANSLTLYTANFYAGIILGIGAILIILSYALPHGPEPVPPKPTPPAPQPQAAK